ncbi:hypothetical protein [Parapedobacter indicus]|uniref:Uncharacterized protein n=2 Tax=Parapedobacter indicus TaxID=1477437 RepID=A0A1I3V321_9SPHI|nr:hypothetical protein [Parapedobacter indicus]PPK99015.1 hypothetical protein CLV26_11545 [Parapedobacter indicus]SFJ88577.1 hypothetical protein SAMN05444682_115132 [Parapedobacter indicus]
MSEKRKPVLTMLLRYEGKNKSNKIELFRATDFDKPNKKNSERLFRIRVNGKWWPNGSKESFFYKSRLMHIINNAIHI